MNLQIHPLGVIITSKFTTYVVLHILVLNQFVDRTMGKQTPETIRPSRPQSDNLVNVPDVLLNSNVGGKPANGNTNVGGAIDYEYYHAAGTDREGQGNREFGNMAAGEEKKRGVGGPGKARITSPNYGADRSQRVYEYMATWNKDWNPSSIQHVSASGIERVYSSEQCIHIPGNLTLCRNIGYRSMRLPNLLEHDNVKELTQESAAWLPLLNLHCHQDTQVFLCSLFAPVCLDRPIWPCRSLCMAVQSACEPRMIKYGFPWPEMLRCDKFPEDNDLCIRQTEQQSISNGDEQARCTACIQPETFENIIDNFCSSDFAVRIKLEIAIISGADLKIVASPTKTKVLDTNSSSAYPTKPHNVRDSLFYIAGGAKCKCDQIEQQSERSLKKAPNWRKETGLRNKSRSSYLVMGKRRNGRLIVSFIRAIRPTGKIKKALGLYPTMTSDQGSHSQRITESSKEETTAITKAMKVFRRGRNHVCSRNGVQLIATPPRGREEQKSLKRLKEQRNGTNGVSGTSAKTGSKERKRQQNRKTKPD